MPGRRRARTEPACGGPGLGPQIRGGWRPSYSSAPAESLAVGGLGRNPPAAGPASDRRYAVAGAPATARPPLNPWPSAASDGTRLRRARPRTADTRWLAPQLQLGPR